jgi:PAS domain S-box-containing protein
MESERRTPMLLRMEFRLATATPLFAFDDDMTVVAWNQGAEELTGIKAEEAVGEPCWAVLGACDDRGSLICHRNCSRVRHARDGYPLPPAPMNVRTADGGRRRVEVDTVSALGGERPLYLHLMHDAPLPEATADGAPLELGPPPELTLRQIEVLELIAEGLSARTIAARLSVSEPTVRNHIRAVLIELGAHSQLEAVFRARAHGLL